MTSDDDTPGPEGPITDRLRKDQLMRNNRFGGLSSEGIRQHRIARLEAHQDGRRAYIADTEGIIARKQLEIENLRAQSPPTPQQRAVELWGCEDGEDVAVCELDA